MKNAKIIDRQPEASTKTLKASAKNDSCVEEYEKLKHEHEALLNIVNEVCIV